MALSEIGFVERTSIHIIHYQVFGFFFCQEKVFTEVCVFMVQGLVCVFACGEACKQKYSKFTQSHCMTVRVSCKRR